MTDWKPAMRVPDPAVRVLDERFRPYVLPLAKLERLATGCRWAEGPVWFGDHRTLVWSDIPNDRMLRWDAASRAGPEREQARSRPSQRHRAQRRQRRSHLPSSGQPGQHPTDLAHQ